MKKLILVVITLTLIGCSINKNDDNGNYEKIRVIVKDFNIDTNLIEYICSDHEFKCMDKNKES
jgi:hypothetical protein